ncbi:hypothetical protein ACH5RR_004027 [Cinchona calisaya]|uniref:Uncharacterized protein n=1 Tax=Cinchona calisaya TaxID=153742 RepID=A0ABD3AWV6_9GENT
MLIPNPDLKHNFALVSMKNESKNDRKKKPWCDCCKKQWHTHETCWKLPGKPPNWKKNPDNHGFQVADNQVFQTSSENRAAEYSGSVFFHKGPTSAPVAAPSVSKFQVNPPNPSCSFSQTSNIASVFLSANSSETGS